MDEILGLRLISIHNLYRYAEFMKEIRTALADGSFDEYRKEFHAAFAEGVVE